MPEYLKSAQMKENRPSSPPASLNLLIRAITHPGLIHSINQDRVHVVDWASSDSMRNAHEVTASTDEVRVVLVADGMSNPAGGEVASHGAIEFLSRRLLRADNKEAIAQALVEVDRQIFDLMTDQTRGMGTTIAGLWIHGATMYFFNVGDSRVYSFSSLGLYQLSRDDTVGGYLGLKKQSSTLVQVLGGSNPQLEITPHVGGKSLWLGESYLICSDGISDLIEDDEIWEALIDYGVQAVDRLASLAIERGGHDNLTAVVVSVV
ncbi:PP2C family serine/threonine-protein phosphatase [Dongia sp.]|uniref:PP2C family protein-serine/threonine phosphatase n=1 Tax=Dongia sp. TaxID=1977262 RepID=UPI0035B13A65